MFESLEEASDTMIPFRSADPSSSRWPERAREGKQADGSNRRVSGLRVFDGTRGSGLPAGVGQEA